MALHVAKGELVRTLFKKDQRNQQSSHVLETGEQEQVSSAAVGPRSSSCLFVFCCPGMFLIGQVANCVVKLQSANTESSFQRCQYDSGIMLKGESSLRKSLSFAPAKEIQLYDAGLCS